MSVEEASILRLLLQLLAKRGIKCEKRAMKMLLMWLKTHGAPTQLHEVFDVDNWEKAGTLIWEAAPRGDLTVAQIMTTWRVVTDNLRQIKADKKSCYWRECYSSPDPPRRNDSERRGRKNCFHCQT